MNSCPDFMALVTLVKFLGEKLKATIPLVFPDSFWQEKHLYRDTFISPERPP